LHAHIAPVQRFDNKRTHPNTHPNDTHTQTMCETLGQEGWFEPYALSLLRRVLSSYKGAKAVVTAADKVLIGLGMEDCGLACGGRYYVRSG
jgi:hypothetical protein